MKKKFKKKMKGRRNGRRNNGGGGAAVAAPSRPRAPRTRRAEAPPWKTIGAAVAGSVGSAIVSGLAVNQKIAEPETISLLMTGMGGVGAYLTEGNARVAFTGVAAAGAGQFALATLGKAALRKAERDQKEQPQPPPQQPAQLPESTSAAPAAEPRRQRAGGGTVVELFRESASDLERQDEDEWRYRDADLDDDEPIEIDLDAAA